MVCAVSEVNSSAIACFLIRDYTILLANQPMGDLSGCSSGEMAGRNLLDLVHPEDRRRLECRVAVMLDGKGESHCKYSIICCDGGIKHVLARLFTVDYHILFKPEPLTLKEFDEMKRHSEIGYRIARSAPELAPISEWILRHYEWWNGEGYPMGLKGEEIPLECRILAIADAYDAMTSDRPYRRAMTGRATVEELKRCSGTQLDPNLVPVFLKVLKRSG